MTEPEDRRFCPHCGRARAPAARFCERCGGRLAAAEPAVEPPSWRARVDACLRRDDLDGASTALDARLAEAPDDAEALALSAHVALERYRVHDAWEAIERALAVAPRSPFVRLQLADYWLRLGVTPKAADELRGALALCDGDEALAAHIRRALATLREHTKSEFGPRSTAGFGVVFQSIGRLFQSKRARRRRDRASALPAPAGERGVLPAPAGERGV